MEFQGYPQWRYKGLKVCGFGARLRVEGVEEFRGLGFGQVGCTVLVASLAITQCLTKSPWSLDPKT